MPDINHPTKWLVLAFTQIDPALVNSHVVMSVGMDGYVNKATPHNHVSGSLIGYK